MRLEPYKSRIMRKIDSIKQGMGQEKQRKLKTYSFRGFSSARHNPITAEPPDEGLPQQQEGSRSTALPRATACPLYTLRPLL
jgi:hypothetical protein